MNLVTGIALVAAHNSVQGMTATPYRSFEEALSMFLTGISLIAFSLVLKPILRQDAKKAVRQTTQMNSKEYCCRTPFASLHVCSAGTGENSLPFAHSLNISPAQDRRHLFRQRFVEPTVFHGELENPVASAFKTLYPELTGRWRSLRISDIGNSINLMTAAHASQLPLQMPFRFDTARFCQA